MVMPVRKNNGPALRLVVGRGPELPFCDACGSDEYLVFEEYIPLRVVPGVGPELPEASYSCLRCGQFNAHEVPRGWEPPGWFWYA